MIDCARAKHRITERGLEFFSEVNDAWLLDCLTLNNLLRGEYEIVKPILDDIEREYLSAVIKPFKDRVDYIVKGRCMNPSSDDIFHYIRIRVKDHKGQISINFDFPYFAKGTMYKGMEEGKEYSLEELGL